MSACFDVYLFCDLMVNLYRLFGINNKFDFMDSACVAAEL